MSCCNDEHHAMLNRYAFNATNACLEAAKVSIPMTSDKHSTDVVPGWKDEVEPVRNKSVFWHNLWAECGRPHTGVVAVTCCLPLCHTFSLEA